MGRETYPENTTPRMGSKRSVFSPQSHHDGVNKRKEIVGVVAETVVVVVVVAPALDLVQ